MLLPDYRACSSNIIASIMASMGLPAEQPGLALLDAALARFDYRNIILLVLDGLSLSILEPLLPADSFLRSAPHDLYSAVFPSTTTAATTTLQSGLNPGRHGWLGWTIYFEQLGKSVDTFPNIVQFSGLPAADFHAAERFLPYWPVTELVTLSGAAQGVSISPYGQVKASRLDDLCAACLSTAREPGRHYVYAYWPEPDHHMHMLGCDHPKLFPIMADIDRQLAQLAAQLEDDSLLLVTADHGLVNASPVYLEDHPLLQAMLLRPPTIEARAAALHVRPGDRQRFADAFQEAFPDQFWLMPSAQALERGLFGPAPYHPAVESMLGDYFAIAKTKHALYEQRAHCRIIGMHGGLSEQEMRLALIFARKAA